MWKSTFFRNFLTRFVLGFGVALCLSAAFTSMVFASEANRTTSEGLKIPQSEFSPAQASVILIEKQSFKTFVLQVVDGEIHRVYTAPNSHGMSAHPTRIGRFIVDRIVKDPTWQNPWTGQEIAPFSRDSANPMGAYAITLLSALSGQPSVSIEQALHGTNLPELIGGRRVSHGCIRHLNGDISEIAVMVQPGSVVLIVDRITSSLNLPLTDFGLSVD